MGKSSGCCPQKFNGQRETHTYSYTLTHIHSHLQTHIHTLTYSHTHIYSHTLTHTYTHTWAYTHIHTHTLTHLHTYTHIYKHIHTQTHTHSHTQCVGLNMLGPGSGTIRRCGLVRVGVALLEEVCGVGFGFQKLCALSSTCTLLPLSRCFTPLLRASSALLSWAAQHLGTVM